MNPWGKNNLIEIFGSSGFDATQYKETTELAIHPREAFFSVLREYGLEIEHIDTSGDIVRCGIAGTKSGQSKPGWYVYYDGVDISSGAYGDWRTGESLDWCSINRDTLTPVQRQEYRDQVDRQKRKAEAQRAAEADRVAGEAQALIDRLPLAVAHDYLTRKAIKPYGVYMDNTALVVPVRNIHGDIRSIQRIYSNSDKYFMAGGQTAGCFHLIGQAFTEPTYMVEGYATGATIHDITGKAAIVAFNAGNLKKVVNAFRGAGNQHQLVIAADNDRKTDGNPGITAANKAADGQYGIKVVCPSFQGGEGSDFNDLMAEQGADAVGRQLKGAPEECSRRLRLLHISELGDLEPTDWLIDNHLPADGFGVLYGPSANGKSFVAIDMGLCVASGKQWHGRDVGQGAVVYVCGEGKKGIHKRIAAWSKHHGIDKNSIKFYVSSKPVPMLDDDALAEFNREIVDLVKNVGKVHTVIIDTLNRNFGAGDENTTKDMTKFVMSCTSIQHDIQSTVLVVHHSGLQDSQRARGNSALRAACDFEMQAEKKDVTAPVRLTCTKMKDDEPFPPIAFRQDVIDIDEATNSCVLTPEKDPEQDAERADGLLKGMGENQREAVVILRRYVARAQANDPDISEVIVERKEFANDLKCSSIGSKNWGRLLKHCLRKNFVTDINGISLKVSLNV